jgi:sulfatase maturation enzyme AslB (radical SAM superfamily)
VSFEKHFCPSPWFHTRINNSGNYEYCRWAVKHDRQLSPNIKQQSPIYWFQYGMSDIRKDLLEGQELPGCSECKLVETHGKISGRQRQLLKIGATTDTFDKSMMSSPWINTFKDSLERNGDTDQLPQDWQIDLGNFCNSACLFCDPYSSSRLASEFKKIGFIKELPPRAWCDDPELLESFLQTLESTPNIAYLHFIGGETLITPAFRIILDKLVDSGLASRTTIGFTTNLTTWDQEIADLLCEFHQVNLGMSIECLHPLNDYVRYGSKIGTVENLLSQWIELAKKQQWLVQLRITPTVLSIWHLETIYKFASEQEIAIESCNFLNDPAFMRPSVLPSHWRNLVIEKLQSWIDTQSVDSLSMVINTRNPEFACQQIVEDAKSYVTYLKNEPDESERLPALVSYLRAMERNRKNCVLDYLPEYEELLRSAGY